MKLRPAGPDDLAGLAALHGAVFPEGWDAAALSGLVRGGAVALLAEAENRVQGFVLYRVAGDEAEILTLAVDRRARRRGFGRILLQQAARDAAKAGAKRLFLEVGAGNEPARGLYEGLGFTPVGQRKGYYAGGEDALILAFQLGKCPPAGLE